MIKCQVANTIEGSILKFALDLHRIDQEVILVHHLWALIGTSVEEEVIMVALAHGQQVIRLDLKVATVGITIIESIATLNLQFPYCSYGK